MTTTDRIEINPKVMRGIPIIRGTRLTVELILRKLGEGAAESVLSRSNARLACDGSQSLSSGEIVFSRTVDRPDLDAVRKNAYFPYGKEDPAMPSIEDTAARRIRAKDRGWAFSHHDLADLGSRSAVDLALHRLERKGTIRRVIRGVYDVPRFSKLLDEDLGPDIDQVTQALARKFGWRIQPSGPAAQNLLGLSTQVPAHYVYLSDGPGRTYRIGKTKLVLKKTALKEAGFRHGQSSLIVHALRSLGHDHVTPQVIAKIRRWLPPSMHRRVLDDTRRVTGWVYAAIKQICRENQHG